MTEHESLDERLERWRRVTDALEPPGGLSERIVAGVLARAARPSWMDLMVTYGRRGVVAAALAAAASLLLATASGTVDELDAEAANMEIGL